jgi:ethanolamine kinase
MADDQDLARKVHFIDFEYSVPCPPAFDLANHFSEWGGYDCDYNMLPTRTTRQRFIEQYFEYYTRHEAELKKSRNLSVRQLCHDVDRYRGMPGLYWGTFSLIQQDISEVKFDWQSFADQKLAEFWAWRRETDGSREQAGEEMPLRERRWCSE